MNHFHSLEEAKHYINAKTPYTLSALTEGFLKKMRDNPNVPPSMKERLETALTIKKEGVDGGLTGVSKASGFIRRMMWENKGVNKGNYGNKTKPPAGAMTGVDAGEIKYSKIANKEQKGKNTGSYHTYGASPFIQKYYADKSKKTLFTPGNTAKEPDAQRKERAKFMKRKKHFGEAEESEEEEEEEAESESDNEFYDVPEAKNEVIDQSVSKKEKTAEEKRAEASSKIGKFIKGKITLTKRQKEVEGFMGSKFNLSDRKAIAVGLIGASTILKWLGSFDWKKESPNKQYLDRPYAWLMRWMGLKLEDSKFKSDIVPQIIQWLKLFLSKGSKLDKHIKPFDFPYVNKTMKNAPDYVEKAWAEARKKIAYEEEFGHIKGRGYSGQPGASDSDDSQNSDSDTDSSSESELEGGYGFNPLRYMRRKARVRQRALPAIPESTYTKEMFEEDKRVIAQIERNLPIMESKLEEINRKINSGMPSRSDLLIKQHIVEDTPLMKAELEVRKKRIEIYEDEEGNYGGGKKQPPLNEISEADMKDTTARYVPIRNKAKYVALRDKLFEELEKITVPKVPKPTDTAHSNRGNIIGAEGRTMTFGFGDNRHGWNFFKTNEAYPEAYKALIAFGNEVVPKGWDYQTITVNHLVKAKKHVDKKNVGASVIVGIGDYTGGDLRVWTPENTNPKDWNIHDKPTMFNGGIRPHETQSFKGNRYTFVFYRQKRRPERKNVGVGSGHAKGLSQPRNPIGLL